MPTVDLTASPMPLPASTESTALASAPRRIGLTLVELQYAAKLAGDAPLPFDVAPPATVDAMQARLGQSPAALDDESFRTTIDGLHDPSESLTRRGLVVDGLLDGGLAGAIGLLASPRLALDIDVAMGGVQARVWHRQRGAAVASLATADGIVFEIGWFPTESWAAELARVAAISEEVTLGHSDVPSYADLPFELVDAAAEASASGRGDLLPVLVARHTGTVRSPLPDEVLDDPSVVSLLAALHSEARGRLRALVADVSGDRVDTVGVVSWTLLGDSWRSLHPRDADGIARLEIRTATPDDLGAFVAPALEEVVR